MFSYSVLMRILYIVIPIYQVCKLIEYGTDDYLG